MAQMQALCRICAEDPQIKQLAQHGDSKHRSTCKRWRRFGSSRLGDERRTNGCTTTGRCKVDLPDRDIYGSVADGEEMIW